MTLSSGVYKLYLLPTVPSREGWKGGSQGMIGTVREEAELQVYCFGLPNTPELADRIPELVFPKVQSTTTCIKISQRSFLDNVDSRASHPHSIFSVRRSEAGPRNLHFGKHPGQV